METRISEPVAKVTESVQQFVDEHSDVGFPDKRTLEEYQKIIEVILGIISDAGFDKLLPDPDAVSGEEAKVGATKLKEVAKEQFKNVIIQSGLDNIAGSILESIIKSPEINATSMTELNTTIDLLIYIASESTNAIFFHLLSMILDTLFDYSIEHAETFWSHVEFRRPEVEEKVFDNSKTSDRIALLELCNSVTDKYYRKTGRGLFDSYKEDSFNDRFKFRVRAFLANLLKLEDNTGLNKYFATGNRIAPDMVTQKTREGNFVKDIIDINKMFRDPYFYIRPANHQLLSRNLDLLLKVYQYLLDEETKYYRACPAPDIFSVPSARPQAEIDALLLSYDQKPYYPEHYWTSQFEEVKKGPAFEELKRKDQDHIYNLFDSTATRQLWLLQIYVICNFLYEMLPDSKRALLKKVDAPSGVKHVSEDFVPDRLLSMLFKIKRELPRLYRSIDGPFAYVLQNLSACESSWWSWLIYGKDSEGKPLLGKSPLSSDNLMETTEKLKNIVLFREKRYFNTYATPQLSRRMKVPIGMAVLKTDVQPVDYEKEIVDMNNKIKNGFTNVMEDRDILLWKQLKQARKDNWLQFGTMLTRDMFPADEIITNGKANGGKMELHEDETKAEVKDDDLNKSEENEDKKRPHSDEDVMENKKQRSQEEPFPENEDATMGEILTKAGAEETTHIDDSAMEIDPENEPDHTKNNSL